MNSAALAVVLLSVMGCSCRQDPPAAPPRPPVPEAPKLTPDQVAVGEFLVEFTNIMEKNFEGHPPRPGQAFVTITKNDPTHGQLEWRGIQFEGQILGWNQEGTSKHRTPSRTGRTVTADFDTKSRLIEIAAGKTVVSRTWHCPIMKEPMARCPGPFSTQLVHKINEVTIERPDRTTVIFSKPAGPAPESDS